MKMDQDKWIEAQKERLLANSEAQGAKGCILCKLGGGGRRYSTLTVTFPWKRDKKTIYTHRFAFMLFTKNFELPKSMQVSHRCHNRRCINVEHLSLEPEQVNKNREHCRGLVPTHCAKHSPYYDCIL